MRGAAFWLIGVFAPVIVLWQAVRVAIISPDFLWGMLVGAFAAAALIVCTGLAAHAAAHRALVRDRSFVLPTRFSVKTRR